MMLTIPQVPTPLTHGADLLKLIVQYRLASPYDQLWLPSLGLFTSKPLSYRLTGNKNPHSFSSLLLSKNVHSFDFIFSNINGEKHVHCKKKQKPIKKKTLQCTQFSPPGQNERKNELHMTAGGVLFCLMQCRQILERVVSKSQ